MVCRTLAKRTTLKFSYCRRIIASVDKIPMVDIGTCQLKDSNQDLYVAPLPLVDILEYPSLASKHSPGIRSPYDSLSPDKRALVERRVRSAAKVMRRQILQNRKESAMVDSVEKRIPHLCSAGGRGEYLLSPWRFLWGAHSSVKETAELNQFQAVYEILRQPASTERRRRPTKQSYVLLFCFASAVTNVRAGLYVTSRILLCRTPGNSTWSSALSYRCMGA